MAKDGSDRGRPPYIPSSEDIANAETYASRGLTKEQIADCLGISYQTLNEKSKEFSDFNDAIKRGKAKGIAHVANKLLDNVNNANVTAQIFYLKCQANWKEKEELGLYMVKQEDAISELE